MEKVLTTNNGESNWQKLSVFGLHSRGSKIGFNSYHGFNGAVLKIDPVSGMKVLFYPAKAPRSECTERTITLKTPGKRGRPCIFSHPIQAHEPGIRGRKAFIGPKIKVEVIGCHQKRGPKPGIKAQVATETLITATQSASNAPKKRGRVSEADRIKQAKKGQIITSKGGSWLMVADGLGSWIAA